VGEFMIGRRLLQFTIESEVGTGSFGRVYLARDENTGRRVALKLLDTAPGGPAVPAHLRHEAKAAAKLSHPGIVTLFGLHQAPTGEWFLVSEYVEGESLASVMARGPLDASEIPRLSREVLSALAHAHERGVFHRDLSPHNILIAHDGSYKIADFGIARVEGATSESDERRPQGTLPYMAPERLRGNKGDALADLFSAGSIFFEALTGRRAFAGSSAGAIVYSILNVTPEFPRVTEGTTKNLVELIEHLLAKEPQDRIGSAQAALVRLTEAEDARQAKRFVSRRASRGWVVGLVVVAVVSVVVGVFRDSMHRHLEKGPVAVLPFENLMDPADSQRMGVMASSFMSTTLAQASDVNLLSNEHVLEVVQNIRADRRGKGELGPELARRTGAVLVVRGQILRIDPSILMTAEVAEASNGRLLGTAQVEALPDENFLTVVGLLGVRILSKLPRSTPRSHQDNSSQESVDLEAYRHYVQGLEYSARGDYVRAQDEFERALQREPDLSWARDRLTFIQWLRTPPGERAQP